MIYRLSKICMKKQDILCPHMEIPRNGAVHIRNQNLSKRILKQSTAMSVKQTNVSLLSLYYNEGEDHTYQNIYNGKWINTAPYGVVHRITSDRTVKGAASFCLDWAFKKCRNLKIDTHKDNQIMQHLLEKNGFTYCGIIYTDDGTETACLPEMLKSKNKPQTSCLRFVFFPSL